MRARHAIAMGLLLLVAGSATGDDRWPGGVVGKLYTQAIFDNTLFYSDQDVDPTFGGNFAVDLADTAVIAQSIDADKDLTSELVCNPAGTTCAFDVNEDGNFDFTIAMSAIAYDGIIGAGDGLGVGNQTNGNTGNSACLGHDFSTGVGQVDKLFEDKDCDFGTVATPETTPAGTTNAEAFITDMQRRLSADVSTDGAGGANDTTGIQATGLKLDLDWIGAYRIEYQILSQSSAAGTGLAYGVEYTGTETSLYCVRTFTSTGAGAGGTTGVIDDVANTNTGQHYEAYAANAASTTAPNMGPNAGVATANSTALESIECNLLTTTAGDLTFYFASETDGTAVTIKANSTVRATPFP